MRSLSMCATLAAALWGCQSAPPPAPTAVPGGGDDAQATAPAQPESATLAAPPVDAEADAQKAKEAEERERYTQAKAKLQSRYAEEAKRWDDELKKSTSKLVARKYSSTKKALQAALKSPHREPGNADRDKYRHPIETLTFFGLKPDMHVFEVGPGKGWYTELLAVILHERGKLSLASYDKKSSDPKVAYMGTSVDLMLGKSPELFGNVERVPNQNANEFNMGQPESQDLILVVRMMHNLVESDRLQAFLAKAFQTLKAGGVLGVVQHRAPEGADPQASAEQGYVPEAWLIEQIEGAGFKLDKKSEINANKKDTKDHPKGVWTLPPSLTLGEQDKEKYIAIGESDRMTLRFVKPKADKTKDKPKADKTKDKAKADKAKADPKADPAKAAKPNPNQ
jgi:predicted methyltransferase